MLQVSFRTDTGAFMDADGSYSAEHAAETANLLANVAHDVRRGVTAGTIKDGNGNIVGRWTLTGSSRDRRL